MQYIELRRDFLNLTLYNHLGITTTFIIVMDVHHHGYEILPREAIIEVYVLILYACHKYVHSVNIQ